MKKANDKNTTLRRCSLLLFAVIIVVLGAIAWIYVRPYVPYRNELRQEYSQAYIMRFDYARDGSTYYANVKAENGGTILVPCTTSDDWIALGEADIRNGINSEVARFVAGYRLMLLPSEQKDAVLAIGHEVFCAENYGPDMKRCLKEDMAIAIFN